MSDIEKIKAKRAEIEAWQKANLDKIKTPEFKKRTRWHRILTDLIAHDTPERRQQAMKMLTEIENG